MAGLVEEVCKYFSWVMVDHPDFCSERELEKAKATMPLQLLRDQAEDEDDDDDTNDEGGKNKQPLFDALTRIYQGWCHNFNGCGSLRLHLL